MLLQSHVASVNGISCRGPRISRILADHPELVIDRDEYNINVTVNGGAPLAPEQVSERFVSHNGAGKAAHLYFHVPLCSYVCHFCNYVKQLLPATGNKDETLERW